MDEITKLSYNFLLDMKKLKIDHFQRSKIIRNILVFNNWSIRELSKQTNISKSAIEDWLLWERIDKEKYASLISNGYNHLQIYRTLRKQKSVPKNELNFKIKQSKNIKTEILNLNLNVILDFLKEFKPIGYVDQEKLLEINEILRSIINKSLDKNK